MQSTHTLCGKEKKNGQTNAGREGGRENGRKGETEIQFSEIGASWKQVWVHGEFKRYFKNDSQKTNGFLPYKRYCNYRKAEANKNERFQ